MKGVIYLKVLIVDDEALIKDSLKIILSLEEDIEVIGTANNGQEAIEMCREQNIDIVLLDIRMPIMDGVLATKYIKEINKNIKIIILTTFKDDEYIEQAMKYGAAGYILKNQSTDSIINAIRIVYNGNAVFNDEVLKSISSMLKKEKKKSIEELNLTEREFEILKLIGEGMSNKEIASKLFLSEGTVRNYVTELLNKLNLRDRTQLAIFYLKECHQGEKRIMD